MSSKRMYFILIGVIGLLSLGILASIVLGNVYLEKKAGRLSELKIQNAVLDNQQAALLQANKDLAKNADLAKIAKAIVPQDKNEAQAALEIVQLAQASNITIKSITFPNSSLGAAAISPPAGDTTGSAPKQPAASAISQAKPVTGIPGVYSLAVDIIPDEQTPISYAQFLDFLNRLENNRRTAQITDIKITPQTPGQGSNLTFTLQINIFLKP